MWFVYDAKCVCTHAIHRTGCVHLCKFSKKKKVCIDKWAGEASRHLEGD
jgi:hypothetical protein